VTPCHLPSCSTLAPHGEHLMHEPESPLALRFEREGVSMWLPDGTLLWRRQPDAVRALRSDLRHWREGALTR
jgi:hypothetical protein